MRYVKRPIPVEAWPVDKDDKKQLSWVRAGFKQGTLQWCTDGGITVRTREGKVKANADDYIIQGVEGELYPCSKSIFVATYDPVGE